MSIVFELRKAALDAAEFLDGLCIGHPVADQDRYRYAKAIFDIVRRMDAAFNLAEDERIENILRYGTVKDFGLPIGMNAFNFETELSIEEMLEHRGVPPNEQRDADEVEALMQRAFESWATHKGRRD